MPYFSVTIAQINLYHLIEKQFQVCMLFNQIEIIYEAV